MKAAFTFPFGSTSCIRFKGYYLSPKNIDTPKVVVKLKEIINNQENFRKKNLTIQLKRKTA